MTIELGTSSADKAQDAPLVSHMFQGRSVFITGASGFIGRCLLEKLLRSYGEGIERIYILMRVKKNRQPSDRLHKQLLNVPIFDHIRARPDGAELLAKIVVVPGDIAEPELGISPDNLQMLLDDPTLSIVFHSAATIKFDEPLKTSTKLNLIATRTVLSFCRRLHNLISLCHVSTAYVNSDLQDNQWIEERVYPIEEEPESVIAMSEIMDEHLLQELKVKLVKKRPNTYTYTKALAEKLILKEAADLPVCIVRPSIVGAAWKEPIAGWVDNLNGPTGLILAIGKGLIRSMVAVREVTSDIVPVDIVINTMIASAYYAAKINNKLPDSHVATPSISPATPPIVHCNSGELNPLTWGWLEDHLWPIIRNYPSCQVFRWPNGTFKRYQLHDLVARIFAHYLPALIMDMICAMMGKKRQLLSTYEKLHGATGALEHFCTTNYRFQSRNMKLVHDALPEADQQDLYMDMENVKWYDYWDKYVLGARRHVLREHDDTLEAARTSFKRAYCIEIVMRAMLVLLLSYCCWPILARPIGFTLQTLTSTVH